MTCALKRDFKAVYSHDGEVDVMADINYVIIPIEAKSEPVIIAQSIGIPF